MRRAATFVVATAGAFLKWAALIVVFVRFHGSWLGLSVVSLMGLLLFRVDRSVVRWVDELRAKS